MKSQSICVLNLRNGRTVDISDSPIIDDFSNPQKKPNITIDLLLDRMNLINQVYEKGDCDVRLYERELCACEYLLDIIVR